MGNSEYGYYKPETDRGQTQSTNLTQGPRSVFSTIEMTTGRPQTAMDNDSRNYSGANPSLSNFLQSQQQSHV